MNVVGEANKKGNRKFRIEEDLKHIKFKPFRKNDVIYLKLPTLKKGIEKTLAKLYVLQEDCATPITWKVDLNYVYISFDESVVYEQKRTHSMQSKNNRVLAIDLNPNYIGWSIVDWKTERDFEVVKTGCYSFKELNDKQLALKLTKKQREEISKTQREAYVSDAKSKNSYLANKRKYEVIEVSK